MRHDVRQVTNLEALLPDSLHGVICLRAPMGKGKTQSIGKPFAAWAKRQVGGMVAICHRVTLTAELARRLDLADYRTATVESIAAKGGVAMCLPSISKLDERAHPGKQQAALKCTRVQVARELRSTLAVDACPHHRTLYGCCSSCLVLVYPDDTRSHPDRECTADLIYQRKSPRCFTHQRL